MKAGIVSGRIFVRCTCGSSIPFDIRDEVVRNFGYSCSVCGKWVVVEVATTVKRGKRKKGIQWVK